MSGKISARSGVIVVALAAYGCMSTACGSRNSEVGGETNWVQGCGERECPKPVSSDDATNPPPPSAPVFTEDLVTRAEQGAQAAQQQRDLTGGALRLIEVPSLDTPEIITSPLGWLALSRGMQDGRAFQGLRTTLYRSQDGVHWDIHPLLESVNDDLLLSGIAFGNGRYVLVGRDGDARYVFWLSGDAEQWTKVPQTLDLSNSYGRVVFVHDRFFAFGFRYIGVSENGIDWTNVLVDAVQPSSAAYGNGRYVISGGPMQVSDDGYAWRSVELPCELPGACITDPSGNVSQDARAKVIFANGKFYSGALVSDDGETWMVSEAPAPIAWTAGRFFGHSYDSGTLQSWTSGADVAELLVTRPTEIAQTVNGRRRAGHIDVRGTIPESVDASWEDGLTCATALCLLLDNQLVLVPPVDQPPLPDHVPRDASGAPLLSDECPVSQMITCDDYAARTNCVCNPDAPREPEYCGDVGSYACGGAFSKIGDEWELTEIGDGGCNCDFVDAAEPPTFGDTCNEGENTCAAPLTCLSIPGASTGGPPPSPYFFCTASCQSADDCPSWIASGYCGGEVQLACVGNVCQPRECNACNDADASCPATP